MEFAVRGICLAIGYVFGLFQTGYIYGKLKNVDIRSMGSGNAGTTNAMRTLGMKAGLITFAGDFLKTILAVLVVRLIFSGSYPDLYKALGMYAGLGAVLGHNFPFYLQFKGGKGIAATAGLIVSFGSWQLIALAAVTFFSVAIISRYVSLASICLVTGFFIEVVIFGQLGFYGDLSLGLLVEIYVLAFVFAALAVFRHRANIVRLMNGTENKFGVKKK